MKRSELIILLSILGLAHLAVPAVGLDCDHMPSGRMVGTIYYGSDLDWQLNSRMDEITTLDFMVINSHSSMAGFVDQVHSEKPSFKILQYSGYAWIPDFTAGDLPGGRPDNPLGQAMYDAFYPDDIARITPTNPDPAVRDTAFTSYAGDIMYVLDLDNPGVAERLAEIIYEQVSNGHLPDADGVFLDGIRVTRSGYGLYGCDPEDRGYQGDRYFYSVDFDGDGIPASDDPGEIEGVTAAIIRMTDRLRELGGPCFMVAGNGYDSLGGEYADPEGRLLDSALECRFREHFPHYWASEDQWLYPFGMGSGYTWNHGDDTVWDWASRGAGQPWIPTPAGGYLMLDNMSTRNAPWLCVASMMVDGAVTMVGQTPGGTSRQQWGGGDPMPRLHELGQPLGAATVNDIVITRDFEAGRIIMEFSNSPAEDMVFPYGGDEINNPDGPFKYLVLGSTPGDTIYAGGGWETVTGEHLLTIDFEDENWANHFEGDRLVVARVDHSPQGGDWALRGNLLEGVVDPVARVPGTSAPALACIFEEEALDAGTRLFLRWYVRFDDFVWSGSGSGTGQTARLETLGGAGGLTLSLGVLSHPGGDGARGGQLILGADDGLQGACAALWGAETATLGNPGGDPLLPADGSWHEIEALLDHTTGTLQIWVDDVLLRGTLGDAQAAAHYPDGLVPLPSSWRCGGLGLPAVTPNQVDGSLNRLGSACAWQLDSIEVYSAYDEELETPGKPVLVD